MSDRWRSGIVRNRAARTVPAGFGGLTCTGDALPGFAPAFLSRSTMGVWPRWMAKSRAVWPASVVVVGSAPCSIRVVTVSAGKLSELTRPIRMLRPPRPLALTSAP